MKLHDWMRKNKKTPEDIADRLGVHAVSVRRYLTGARIPHQGVMKDIRALTKGKVTALDFYE